MKWTEEANNYLRYNIGRKSTAELAIHFRISKNAIYTKCCRLGLKRIRKLRIDNMKIEDEVMCATVRVQTCAPTKVILVNGKRTEIWGKPSFIEKLEARK